MVRWEAPQHSSAAARSSLPLIASRIWWWSASDFAGWSGFGSEAAEVSDEGVGELFDNLGEDGVVASLKNGVVEAPVAFDAWPSCSDLLGHRSERVLHPLEVVVGSPGGVETGRFVFRCLADLPDLEVVGVALE